MAKRLAQLIFISVVCLLIIFILLQLHFWSATFIEEPHLWRNLNGLSMARANELFMDCCRATRIPQPCWKYCKYNIDSSLKWSLSDVQDRKSCDLVENIELLLKCANGMYRQHDLRPCCLKNGAITSEKMDEDSCSQFCHPHQSDSFKLKPETILCATKMKAIGYCHFTNLKDKE